MLVYVRNLVGKTLFIQIEASDTIEELKNKIFIADKTPLDE